ncbi:MAG TPA: rod shape-determining protein MreC [Gemmatimonadales bacterium]|nr:rod shape-determining protein MreC [Gemmatimonadales bacterium]
MNRAPGRATSRSDTLLFLGCLVLSCGAIALPERLSLHLANAVRETALLPVLWLQQRAVEGRTSRSRFQALQAERDSAVLAAQSLGVLAAENERLRGLLALRERTAMATVPAEVLHQVAPTDGRTLLLALGAATGVRPGDPVISPEGLVGVVLSVAARSTVAMSWGHPDFRVSAATEDGSVLGIVAPSVNTEASETFLEFRGVAYRDTVATGTLVLTSGLGGVYPRGIPIGRVAGVRKEELGWERIYRLAPLANPGHLGHVLVLRVPAPGELAP